MKYITIVDPRGATQGYDGPYVAISHRVLFDGRSFYGFESANKLFDTHQELIDFLIKAIAQPTGASGEHKGMAWSVE